MSDTTTSTLDAPLTEQGNAERFAAAHANEVMYVAGQEWRIWDGKAWVPDRTGSRIRLAKADARALFVLASQTENDERRKAIASWAQRSESARAISSTLTLAESERSLVNLPERLDADPYAFNVQNGTINLQTGELRAHAQRDRITKTAPVAYKPNATSDRWTRFLQTATDGDTELEQFLQRAVGYSLTGDTREEKLFSIHGGTGSGKSTFTDTVGAVMGDYGSTADFESFLKRSGDGGIRNDIARLVGKRYVVSNEVDDGARLADGLIKSITGGDIIAARFLRQEFFEFRPQFKLWFAANHRPRVNADDGAMWRRIVQIPFTNSVPERQRDDSLKRHLRHDPDAQTAVLAWAVQGCLDWQKHGLGIPQRVRDYTDAYRADNDPIAAWLTDNTEPDKASFTGTAALRHSYEQWCTNNGEQPTGPKAFSQALTAKGYIPHRTKTTRGYFGLRVTGDA